MNRSVEIQEILSFIESSNLQNSEEITKDCLLRFTEEIDEEFLLNRAKEVIRAYESDKEFKEAFDKLSATCDGNTQCKACPVNKYCNNYL